MTKRAETNIALTNIPPIPLRLVCHSVGIPRKLGNRKQGQKLFCHSPGIPHKMNSFLDSYGMTKRAETNIALTNIALTNIALIPLRKIVIP